MLSVVDAPRSLSIAELRRHEFARLDEADLAYLDYTGAALYADRQVVRHLDALRQVTLGNPHSESQPSLTATAVVDDARRRTLDFFDADPSEYVAIFTANCSAAIKLVAEAYPFGRLSQVVLSADNHNSINGLREFARRARATITYVPLDATLRLVEPERHFTRRLRDGNHLFAFPAQSNFSGVQHPLALVDTAQQAGFDVLLDAAAFAPSNRLSLRERRPEFVVASFYKMFGYPTGVGVLIAKRETLARLKRPWFAGGTVNFVSVQNGIHELKYGPERFEDGTPSFLTLDAIRHGFDLLDEVGVSEIHAHVARLTRHLIDGLLAIGGRASERVVIYGPTIASARGGTVAFNVLDSRRKPIRYMNVECAARDRRIAIRGGCFCNPGAAEHAFGFDVDQASACLSAASKDGFTIERFATCMEGSAVGALRASVGLANNERDVDRLLDLVDGLVARR